MSVLNAFLSTWSNARQTFGEGTRTARRAVRQAAPRCVAIAIRLWSRPRPRSRWTGGAANAYGAANTEHGRVIRATRRAGPAPERSRRPVSGGRRRWTSATSTPCASGWWTPAASVPQGQAGERMRMRDRAEGDQSGQEIIQRSNGELNTISGGIRGLDESIERSEIRVRSLDGRQRRRRGRRPRRSG